MRVLYLSNGYTPHDRRFLGALTDLGEKIIFARLTQMKTEARLLPDGVQDAGVLLPDGEGTDLFAAMPALERIVDSEQPDVVQAGPIQTCTFLAAMAGCKPLLAMSWGSDILIDADRDDRSRWVTRYALERSDAFFCDCDAVREKTVSSVYFPDDAIVQFPWWGDSGRRTQTDDGANLRNRLGWQDCHVVVTCRAWEPVYGILTAVESFARAAKKDPALRLLLVGDGALHRQVCDRIAELRVGERVHQTGPVDEERLLRLFSASDVYLSCSTTDGSSVSLLQAMACGLPSVVSDIPGNREWVTDGSTGWLAPVGDSAAFGSRLTFAASLNAVARSRVSERAIAAVRARADWSASVRSLSAMYRHLQDGIIAGIAHNFLRLTTATDTSALLDEPMEKSA